MKLKHIFEAKKLLAEMKKNPSYSEAIYDRLTKHSNPLFFYDYAIPREDEYFISLHNHSDSGCYSIEEMAKVAAERGYKIFGITDHNQDIRFDGKRVIYHEFDGRGIYVVRGMECRCKTKDSFMKDVLLLGYENGIKPFKDIKGTIAYCKEKSGIVIATSPFNEGARGLSKGELEKTAGELDAVEILNSGSGAGPLCTYDILAEEFAQQHKIAGIYANDAHTLREIGLAGFGVKKRDFKVLGEKTPEELTDNPDILISELRRILQENKVNNYGSYIPKFSFLYHDKLRTLSHKHAVLRPG